MSMLLGLVFGNWKRIAALLVLGVLVLAWARFQLLESQHRADAAALAHAHQMLAAAQAQASLYRAAMNEAQASIHVNEVSRRAVAGAQREINHALDAHALYVAWSAGIDSVRNDREPALA